MALDKIMNEIHKEIVESLEFQEQVERENMIAAHNGREYDHYQNETYENEKQWMAFIITERMEELQKAALEANFLFFDAPFSVYEDRYLQKLEFFVEENPDAIESDFIREELAYIFNPELNRVLEHKGKTLFYHQYINDESKLKFAAARKIDFLAGRLNELGKDYDLVLPNENNDFELAQVYLIPSKTPIRINKQAKTDEEKLKWTGGTAQLGLIIGHLAESGFIEAPKKPNGEINYARFGKLVLENFESNSKADSLSKYLNIHSDKAQETQGKLKDQDFYIPHIKSVS